MDRPTVPQGPGAWFRAQGPPLPAARPARASDAKSARPADIAPAARAAPSARGAPTGRAVPSVRAVPSSRVGPTHAAPAATATPSPPAAGTDPAWQAIHRLERELGQLNRVLPRWRKVAWASVALAVVSAAGAFAAITANPHAYEGMAGDTFTYDETKFGVTSKGMFVAAGAVGATGAPTEIAIAVGGVYTASSTTAITAGHWYYQVDLYEAGIATVTSGTFTAELFVDGTSMGTLQFTQGTSVGATVEGVSLRWSLGSSSLSGSASYVIKVT